MNNAFFMSCLQTFCNLDSNIYSFFYWNRFRINMIFEVLTPPGTQQEDFIIHLDTEEADEITEEVKKLGLKVELREH